MIVIIRRLVVLAAAAALLAAVSACSALLGPTPDEIVDKGIETRVAELIEVLGVSDAQPLDVPKHLSINGEYVNNDAGFGTYYVLFGDGCWATVVFGRINEESGRLEAGWADRMPNFEAEDGYGQLPINNADDMAAFAAASCTGSTATTDSP
jgi:hypothetical protein